MYLLAHSIVELFLDRTGEIQLCMFVFFVDRGGVVLHEWYNIGVIQASQSLCSFAGSQMNLRESADLRSQGESYMPGFTIV